MSSILDALKKLEADKSTQTAPVEAPPAAWEPDNTYRALLGDLTVSPARGHRLAPVTLVLAGGLFAVCLVGVSVLLALIFMVRSQGIGTVPATTAQATPSAATAAAPAPGPDAAAPASPEPQPAPESASVAESPPVPAPAPEPEPSSEPAPAAKPETDPEPESVHEPVSARARETPPRPEPPAETPAREPQRVETRVTTTAPVRYERYDPAAPSEEASDSTPIPEDIRKLPMLSRVEKSQYGLDNLSLNMLNEANAQRPTGNAIINLEKVFVGETIPGSNARLIGVENHGIAVEIMSTGQRYYLPR